MDQIGRLGWRTRYDQPRLSIPDPDRRVEATSGNSEAIESDSVDLLLMTPEYPQAFAGVYVPQLEE